MVAAYITNIVNYLKKLNEAPVPPFAYGFVLGMFLGLIPFSINSFIITLLIFILNVDKAAGVLGTVLFAGLGILLDPAADQLGHYILVNLTFLKPFFTFLYNLPFFPFTGFNNTLVMGNTLCGIILAYPTYLAVTKFFALYRASKYKDLIVKILGNKYFSLINKVFGLSELYKQEEGPQ